MKKMGPLSCITSLILVIGGLNWGAVGLLHVDLVAKYLPANIAQIVYIVVGLAAILQIIGCLCCCCCKKKACCDTKGECDSDTKDSKK
jgi:hypothetical protein